MKLLKQFTYRRFEVAIYEGEFPDSIDLFITPPAEKSKPWKILSAARTTVDLSSFAKFYIDTLYENVAI